MAAVRLSVFAELKCGNELKGKERLAAAAAAAASRHAVVGRSLALLRPGLAWLGSLELARERKQDDESSNASVRLLVK